MNNVLSRGGFALVAVCGTALAFGGLGLHKAASASQPARPAEPGGAPEEPPGLDQMGQQLVAGLRSVEGCLGVDTGNFKSGKITIVAWFENKAAVERWYNHPTHVRMIGAVGSRPEDRTPLEHVDDPDIPIMVMASISFDGRPALQESPIPFSQISIELFAPLPGGASINGRLAPEAFEVEHHRSLAADG